jgi:hypothetical protein
VYRRTETGWIKTLDGVDILANTIQANSLNVLAKNVINPFVDGTSEGWTLGPGCSLVDDAAAGFKVLQLADDTAGTPKINAITGEFEVLPDDIFIVKFGVECLTDDIGARQGIYIGIGPAYSSVSYRLWAFNTEIKRWQIEGSTNNPYFLADYKMVARNHYTTYVLGKDVNIQNVPAPERTSDDLVVCCIQLLTTTTCRFRDGSNNPSAPRAFKLICPQVYRAGGGKIIAENIEAHSITANEIMAKALTANEVALHTLTGDEMAMNTITTKNLAIGDFTNLATVNENIPASMLPAGFISGQTLIDGGYIIKAAAGNSDLIFTDFPEGILQAGDEYYFEFSAKAAAPTSGAVYAWGYSSINRVNGVVVGAAGEKGYSSENLTITTDEQRFTGAIRITSPAASAKYIIFGFHHAGTKTQVYFKNVIIRKKNAGQMIVDGSIETNHMKANSIEGNRIKAKSLTGDRLEANTVSAENLNVLAKNVINPFVDGTSEGWDTGAPVASVDGLGYVLKPSEALGKNFQSNDFTVLPDDIYRFTFGVESLVELKEGLGLYIGLRRGQAFNLFKYSFTDKKWLPEGLTNNSYFLRDYRTAARKYYTTYIFGSRVNISDVPAPIVTDTAYQIFCLQLTGTDTVCRMRSGYDAGQPPDAAWYLIQPQVYRIGGGKITAENIVTKDLSAISASLGRMTGDGNPDDSQYKLVLSDGFSGNENKKGTFLLGAAADSAYLRRWWDGNVWHMAIKLATFIVDSIASNIFGRFRVFRTGQNSDTDPSVFDTTPGADPQGQAVNHASSEFRGAFRVRKSNNPLFPGYNDVVLETLPNGHVNVPEYFCARERVYSLPIQSFSIPPPGRLTNYYVKIGKFNYSFGGKLIISESGNTIEGKYYIDLLGGQPGAGKITVTYGKFNVYAGTKAFLLTAPDGTAWNSIMELWIQVTMTDISVGEFNLFFSDSISGTFTPAANNYQSAPPSGIIQTAYISNTGGIATSGEITAGNLSADSAAITGTTPSTSPGTGALTVAGGVGIAGALNVGGTAGIAGTLGVEGDLMIGGKIRGSGYVVDASHQIYGTGVPLGTLYNALVNMGYKPGDFILCSGNYINDTAPYTSVFIVQYIYMGTNSNTCAIYGMPVDLDGKVLATTGGIYDGIYSGETKTARYSLIIP